MWRPYIYESVVNEGLYVTFHVLLLIYYKQKGTIQGNARQTDVLPIQRYFENKTLSINILTNAKTF